MAVVLKFVKWISNNENPVTVIPKITVLINGLKISAELIKFIKFACSANSRKII